MEVLSRGVGEAVWEALAEAAEDVLTLHARLRPDARDTLPLIPHIVAADDLCVSLPAAYGWQFVVSYCEHFATATRKVVSEAGAGWTPPKENSSESLFSHVPPATASGALVIAHKNEPFSTCLDAAESLLKEAKRQVDGEKATVMWADVSREGFDPPSTRAALQVDSIDADLLDALSELPQSLRRNLTSDASEDRLDAAARLEQRARRLGLFDRRLNPAIGEGLRRFRLDPATFLDHVAISDWWMR
jgi:hypothetical protein